MDGVSFSDRHYPDTVNGSGFGGERRYTFNHFFKIYQMTVIIRKSKNSSNYVMCCYVGTILKPLVVGSFDFLVSFAMNERYVYYFNHSEEKAIAI